MRSTAVLTLAAIALAPACTEAPPPRAPAPDLGAYVVAPQGDDDSDGSASSPWRTLAHAADRVGAGDTVTVERGTYRGFQLEHSGTPDAPIRFIAERGAVIEDPDRPDGINLEGASHVEIRGFTVTGARRAGIRAVECEGVTVRDNVVDANGKWGIFTGFCDDLRIVGNEASRSAGQHGIYLSNSGDRPIVRGNEMWGNARAGVQLNGDASMGGDGVISGAVIADNVIRQNGEDGAAAINLDGVQGAVIANNLLHDNEATGIALYRIDGGGPSSGNRIVHNTIEMPAAHGRWCVLLRDGATDNTLLGNILLNRREGRGAVDASPDSTNGLRSDHNLVTDRFTLDDATTVLTLGDWRERTGQDAHSDLAPPRDQLFADPAAGDYRLAAGSPARDAGAARLRAGSGADVPAPERDLDGTARPQGKAPDLGCYEAR